MGSMSSPMSLCALHPLQKGTNTHEVCTLWGARGVGGRSLKDEGHVSASSCSQPPCLRSPSRGQQFPSPLTGPPGPKGDMGPPGQAAPLSSLSRAGGGGCFQRSPRLLVCFPRKLNTCDFTHNRQCSPSTPPQQTVRPPRGLPVPSLQRSWDAPCPWAMRICFLRGPGHTLLQKPRGRAPRVAVQPSSPASRAFSQPSWLGCGASCCRTVTHVRVCSHSAHSQSP